MMMCVAPLLCAFCNSDLSQLSWAANKSAVPEGIMVGAELVGVGRDACGGRDVPDIVIPGNIVDRNRRVHPGKNAFEFLDLRRVANPVHQITGDDNERRMEPVDRGYR